CACSFPGGCVSSLPRCLRAAPPLPSGGGGWALEKSGGVGGGGVWETASGCGLCRSGDGDEGGAVKDGDAFAESGDDALAVPGAEGAAGGTQGRADEIGQVLPRE